MQFNAGFTNDGNRSPVTISGNTIVMRLSIFADNSFGIDSAAFIPSEYAPREEIVMGCFLSDNIYGVQDIGYIYIGTSGSIQVVDAKNTGCHLARAIISYQI